MATSFPRVGASLGMEDGGLTTSSSLIIFIPIKLSKKVDDDLIAWIASCSLVMTVFMISLSRSNGVNSSEPTSGM